MCKPTRNQGFFSNPSGYHDSTAGHALVNIHKNRLVEYYAKQSEKEQGKEVTSSKPPKYRLAWRAASPS